MFEAAYLSAFWVEFLLDWAPVLLVSGESGARNGQAWVKLDGNYRMARRYYLLNIACVRRLRSLAADALIVIDIYLRDM